ncbi:MAG: siderophore-interacting protein [bacterium]
MTALAADPVAAWRFFDCRVAAATRLSPSFTRLTLAGPDLDEFADNGWDQRFKLILPDPLGTYDSLPRAADWYRTWRRLPADRRNPIRTYTVRAARPAAGEVDVDLVLHGDAGPASRFAARATAGDRLVVLGPNAVYDGAHGGLEFQPPAPYAGPFLLVGDATATPAVLSILAHLPADAHGEAVLEVPEAGDVLPVEAPASVRATWLVQRPAGTQLPAAVGDALDRLGVRDSEPGGGPLPHDGGGDGLLWDVPDEAAEAVTDTLYAWIAGESSLVTALRRNLVRDRGIDRRSVAFMGYWRSGIAGG